MGAHFRLDEWVAHVGLAREWIELVQDVLNDMDSVEGFEMSGFDLVHKG